MENSIDCVAIYSNSPDRKLGTKDNSIILIFCNHYNAAACIKV
ncbi:MAG: hypothetical protein Q7S74_06750 [Nanoarchaeota archaeon]|nr:hypothetical protein [Nanoarchaeota archaeon]